MEQTTAERLVSVETFYLISNVLVVIKDHESAFEAVTSTYL